MGVSDVLTYEKWMEVSPKLLWANERVCDLEQVKRMSATVMGRETSAWLILEGAARLRNRRQVLEAGPGEWLVTAPGERIQEFEGPLRLLSVTFRAAWAGGRHLFDEGLPMKFLGEDFPELEVLGRRISDGIAVRIPQRHYYLGLHPCSVRNWLYIQGCLAEWMEGFSGVMEALGVGVVIPKDLDPRLELAMRLIVEQPVGLRLSVDLLAERVGLSRRQLERFFASDVGRSPNQVFEERRIEEAMHLLAASEVRVKEVASALGFGDLSNFNRWFKRVVGQSPRGYMGSFQ